MPVVACPNPAPVPVHGVVQFDAAEFVAIYPEFNVAPVTNANLLYNFGLASILLNNSCCSVVQDANIRMALLYLLTAHMTALGQGSGGQAPSGIVGRVDSAAEGSVNVSASYATEVSQSMAYFIQTKYGAEFWALTATYRTARYFPPLNQCVDAGYGPGGPYYPFGVGPGCGC